ncbi:MAG: hypothetical protein H6728_00040 [Myxococcales bacterium]|nr:hypothetical protein [Myxococcales bacterium]
MKKNQDNKHTSLEKERMHLASRLVLNVPQEGDIHHDKITDMQGALGQSPPLSYSWGDFLDQLATEHGGLAALARHLQDIAPPSARLSEDPMTVERGLRRLRHHENAPANKYGWLLLRCFGLPSSLVSWAREMGQYHSRSSDLPVHLRADQLRLWDRPPVSESKHAIWVQLGLASLAHRARDFEQLAHRLKLAKQVLHHAEPAAKLEVFLFEARLAADAGDEQTALAELRRVESLLADAALSSEEYACYYARLQDQFAFVEKWGWKKEPDRLLRVLARYDSIPCEDAPPFARFRREHGRAWCLWRLARKEEALLSIRVACDVAGDGGFLRLRCMALQLWAYILELQGDEAFELLDRARRIARRLGDALLLGRIEEAMAQGLRQR